MEDSIKIAHLSDLHLRKYLIRTKNAEAVDTSFDGIIDLLQNLRPHGIIITGDLVHHPTFCNYGVLRKKIAKLYNDLSKTIPDLHIICVPGNHDYSIFGNKFINFMPGKCLYGRYEKVLIYPEDLKSSRQAALSFFKTHRVAIFPLDSNRNSAFIGWAQGRISEVDTVLRKLDSAFRQIAADNTIDYERCPKMAILHHHPLPVSTLKHEQPTDAEQFMSLRGAYTVLHSLNEFDIRLVFHGHKHISGISRFILADEGKIIISACASSCKIKEAKREVKLITLSVNGVCSVDSYIAEGEKKTFVANPELSKQIIDYEEARKNNWRFKYDRGSPIKEIKEKKKIVRLRPDGTAPVDLALTGIVWEPGASERFVKERFRADYGRIIEGLYEFTTCPVKYRSNPIKWGHPQIDGNEFFPTPDLPDKFEMKFELPSKGYPDEEFCCKIAYVGANCFALNKNHHEITYCKWPKNYSREEATSIAIDSPTEFLQMKIQFETKRIFPDPEEVYVDVSPIVPFENEKDRLFYLQRRYTLNEEEKKYLDRIRAVKVHVETKEIELIVMYPQPGMVYTVRWEVPDDRLQPLSPKDRNLADKLRDDIYSPTTSRSDNFYSELLIAFRTCDWWDDSLQVFLLGYDKASQLLSVKKFPESSRPISDLCVGRGAAGKAFKMNEVQCWKKPLAGDSLSYPIERTLDGLDPFAVMALPLSFPHLFAYTESAGKRDFTKLRPSVFAVISIVATKESSKLEQFFKILEPKELEAEDELAAMQRKLDRTQKLRNVYDVIQKLLKKNFVYLS